METKKNESPADWQTRSRKRSSIAVHDSPPDKAHSVQRSRSTPYWLYALGLVAAFSVMSVIAKYYKTTTAPAFTEPSVITSVKQLVSDNYVISPATIKWRITKILRTDNNWSAIYLEYDAQNEYGALLRYKICAAAYEDAAAVRMRHVSVSILAGCSPGDVQTVDAWLKRNSFGGSF
jgi:hypothetical protein